MDKTRQEAWQEKAKLLRLAMVHEQPAVTIEKVMDTLGYNSKGAAYSALEKLQEIGAVKWIDGKWYLV